MYRLALASILTLPSCLAKKLEAPAEDHAVQTKVIAERCRGEGAEPYKEAPCSSELQKDLDAMAHGAECISAISKTQRCGAEP